MKKKYILAFFLLIPLFYVLHIFISTGFFRTVENSTNYSIQTLPVIGAEDIDHIPGTNFLIISSDDRAKTRDGIDHLGALYLLNPGSADNPVNLTKNLDFDFHPHGIDIIQLDSTTFKIWVINHTNSNHFIEIFLLEDSILNYIERHEDVSMLSPNDITAIDSARYYFTNDHGATSKIGKFLEDYLGLAKSNVVFFDGVNYQEVASNIAYANGIQYSNTSNLLFVASPRAFIVKVYETKADFSLQHIEDIYAGTGVDNIFIDTNQKLWIGCHPNLLAFTAYASGRKEISPSEIITIDYFSKDNYEVKSIFTNKGDTISASTVAIPFEDKIYIGTVMDENLLIIEPEPEE